MYIRMEPNIAGTADLLQEPWFLGALGGVVLLLLITLALMLLSKKGIFHRKRKDSFQKSEHYYATGAVAIPFHPCVQPSEHGTLLPNSIVGLCRGPAAGCSHSKQLDPHLQGQGWMRCEGDWAKQACQLNNAMFMTGEPNTENYVESSTLLKASRNKCPIHGHSRKHSDTTERNCTTDRSNLIPNGAAVIENGTSSGSSTNQSYPETVSVHSQRSTPLSQRSEKRLLAVQQTVNWSDLLPPPPVHPPPDRFSLDSCQEETDNFSAVDYKCNKHKHRRGSYSPQRNYCPRENSLGRNSKDFGKGDVKIVDVQASLPRRRQPRAVQASLDRNNLFHNRHYNRNVRNSLVLDQFLPNNLAKARSCESSIANDDENDIMSSENELESVEYIDDGINSETSPCLSSEASFFLDTEFTRRPFVADNRNGRIPREVNGMQQHILSNYNSSSRPLRPARPNMRNHSASAQRPRLPETNGLSQGYNSARKPKRNRTGTASRSNEHHTFSDIGVMTLPVDRAERCVISNFKQPLNRPKKLPPKHQRKLRDESIGMKALEHSSVPE